MRRYVVRRLLGVVPLVLGVTTVLFFVLHLAPGDPASHYLAPGLSPEAMERIRADLGLDDPVHVQYVRWVAAFLQGDFGYSIARGRPVADLFAERLPNTLLLGGAALAFAFLAGIVLGAVQAARRGTLWDAGLSVAALFFYSMPSFWLAVMLVLVFSLYAGSVWNWPVSFPASGMASIGHEALPFWERLLDRLRHLVLPTLSLGLVMAAGVARYVRAGMVEALAQDHVRAARAKGLSERRVLLGHGLRNALLPVLTLLGLHLPLLFSGAVFVEAVFAWPGIGLLVVEAIGQRDAPVVLAGAFVFALVVVAGNLLADVLYAVADPRIRYE